MTWRHPRPLLRRRSWTSLAASWDFAIDGDARWSEPGDVRFDRYIRVPFAPETAASGVDDRGLYRCVWYRRTVAVPRAVGGSRVVINFGAVDHEATVWVDGQEVVRHEGGYTPFAADVTAFAGDEHELVVRAFDEPSDVEKPRGKQDWEPEPHAIWYPRTTGIWQPVWLEEAPVARIVSVRWWTDDLRTLRLDAQVEAEDGARLIVALSTGDEWLSRTEHRVAGGQVRDALDVGGDVHWSPERPVLVDATLQLRSADGVDRVRSYTAMRTVGASRDGFLLNGEPYPLRMALDQGYWADGGMTAPSDAALRADVELAKSLGLNGVRKHQKAEDPRWLEHCDRLGLLVFGEMPSPRVFSPRARELLEREWRDIVERDRSHPSIAAWVPFNESWGVERIADDPAQLAHVSAIRDLTHALDPTRPVISNDGWEWAGGDIVGVHDYATDPATLRARYGSPSAVARTLDAEQPEKRQLLLAARRDQPALLSEFGGLRVASDEDGWGYATVSVDEFAARVADLCAAARSPALAGFCYTQLTDTYQEQNGLVRMDRSPKADVDALRAAFTGTREAEPR